MSDEELRHLERRALSGDQDAAFLYAMSLERHGEKIPTPDDFFSGCNHLFASSYAASDQRYSGPFEMSAYGHESDRNLVKVAMFRLLPVPDHKETVGCWVFNTTTKVLTLSWVRFDAHQDWAPICALWTEDILTWFREHPEELSKIEVLVSYGELGEALKEYNKHLRQEQKLRKKLSEAMLTWLQAKDRSKHE